MTEKNWKEIDERLIRRGEILLDLEFLENWDKELEKMNRGKVGRPYQAPNTYILLLATVRFIFDIKYRQLEGFTRKLHQLIPKIRPMDYSGIRKRIVKLKLDLDKSLRDTKEPITIAVDSSGVKVFKGGGWIERKHGKKKKYIKIHFAVDIKTKEVVAMSITTDETHDSREAPKLIDEASKRRKIRRAHMDSAYNYSRVYDALEARGIEPSIKPKKNNTGEYCKSALMRREVKLFRFLGYERWRILKRFGERWAVETSFAVFKGVFGEHVMSREWQYIVHELGVKAVLYNFLVNLGADFSVSAVSSALRCGAVS